MTWVLIGFADFNAIFLGFWFYQEKSSHKNQDIAKSWNINSWIFFFEFSQEKFEAGKDTFWAISGDLGAKYYLIWQKFGEKLLANQKNMLNMFFGQPHD